MHRWGTMAAIPVALSLAISACGVEPELVQMTDASVPGAGTSPSSPGVEAEPAAPSVGVMDEARFWAVIEQSRAGGAGMEAQASELERILAAMAPAEIAAFDAAFVVERQELYSWELWGAAYVLLGGCSDDCFDYFRAWVVGQGEEYFNAVRADPEALAERDVALGEELGDAELLSYIAYDAYVAATGREMDIDYPDQPGLHGGDEPSGEKWDEDDWEGLRARYPRLEPLPPW